MLNLWVILLEILTKIVESDRKEDEEDLLKIFMENQNLYIKRAAAIVGSYEDGRDVVKDVMLKLLLCGHLVYRTYDKLYSSRVEYINSMVIHAAYDLRRKRRHEVLGFENIEEIVSVFDVEEEVIARDQTRLILETIAMLPLKDQMILEMFMDEKMSLEQAANLYGVDKRTIERRLVGARDRLKIKLKEKGIMTKYL